VVPVDIILVNYNGLEYLQLCLFSLKLNTSYPNYSIYIWDNNSQPSEVELLRLYQRENYENISFFYHHENIGPIAAWNRMVEKLREEYGSLEKRCLLFLGEDVICRKGWLTALVRCIDGDPKVGIVSFGNLTNPNVGELQEVQSFSFDCALVRGECIEDVGQFDERFFYAFADGKFCQKAQSKGWKIVATPENLVKHLGAAIVRKIEGWDSVLRKDRQTLKILEREEL